MSDSRELPQPCLCTVYKQRSDDGSTIAGKKDFKKLTPLLRELDARMIDATCPLCGGSIDLRRPYRQFTYPFYTDGSSSPFEGPQNVIIVNQISVEIKGKEIDRKKFFSLFSQYGKIKDAYLCNDVPYRIKSEKVARIMFKKEEDACEVSKAFKEKLIKYEDHVLMITLISDDDCPIEVLSDDCLRLIFEYITDVRDKWNVESVCKRFRSISRESYSSVTTVSTLCKNRTWRTIISRAAGSLRNVEIEIPWEKDRFEVSFEDSINNSSISGEEDSHREASSEASHVDASSEYVVKNEENLRRGKAWVEDAMESLSLISENLVKLEKFIITVNCDKHSSVNPQLDAIIAKNRSLKCLRLWLVDLVGHDFIDSLPAGMEEIQIFLLDLPNFTHEDTPMHSKPVNISRFGNLQVLALFRFEIGENQLKGIESLENLRALNFTMSDVHPSNIEKIVHFTKLEFLAIPNCRISNSTFENILKNNKGLKHLNINDITRLTDSSFQYVPQLPDLQVLLMRNLENVTDEYFTPMPKLKIVDCTGCISLTDAGIECLFTPDSMLKKLSIAECSVTVASVETAYQWRPRGAQVLTLYVDGKIVEKWENSEWNKFLSQSPDLQKISLIDGSETSMSEDEIRDNWLEIFDQLG